MPKKRASLRVYRNSDLIERHRLGSIAQRICIRCSKQFESSGPGNRICPACECRSSSGLPDLKETQEED